MAAPSLAMNTSLRLAIPQKKTSPASLVFLGPRRIPVVDLVLPALQPRVADEGIAVERRLLEHALGGEQARARANLVHAPPRPVLPVVADGDRVVPLWIHDPPPRA